MMRASCRAACRVGWLQGQRKSEHCPHFSEQEERHDAHRGNLEGFSPSVVVLHYPATCVRGKSIAKFVFYSVWKRGSGGSSVLHDAGHVASRGMLSPDVDHSTCLSSQVSPLVHTCQQQALSDPGGEEDTGLGAQLIFQPTPCPAFLNFAVTSSCPGVHSSGLESFTKGVMTQSPGDQHGRKHRRPRGVSQELNSKSEEKDELSMAKKAPLGAGYALPSGF